MKRLWQLLIALFLTGALLAAANIVADLRGAARIERIANTGRVACFLIGLGCICLFFYKDLSRTWRQRRRTSRSANRLCGNCGYDLTGNVSGICPECGEPVEKIETPENEKPTPQDQGHRITPRSGK